jgi:hypothetical protein
MARNRSNIIYFEVEGQPLNDVTQVSFDDSREGAEEQPTMNRTGRALGYRKGRLRTEASITTRVSIPREYNWHGAYRAGTILQCSYEEEGGTRWQMRDVLITAIRKGAEVDGETTEEISVRCLDHREEP